LKARDALTRILDRFTEEQDGDCRIGRTIPLVVPKAVVDQAIANAAMSILANQPMMPTDQYQPTEMQAGQYEVTVAIHIRRIEIAPNLVN
jgi:hypothetical protein